MSGTEWWWSWISNSTSTRNTGPQRENQRANPKNTNSADSPTPARAEEPPRGTSGQPIKCFHCGQQSHQLAECLAPSPQLKGETLESAKPRKLPHKTMKKGKFAHQAIEISPPPDREEGTPAQGFLLYDSNDKGEDDLLVSEAIHPFIIKSKLAVPKEHRGRWKALQIWAAPTA